VTSFVGYRPSGRPDRLSG